MPYRQFDWRRHDFMVDSPQWGRLRRGDRSVKKYDFWIPVMRMSIYLIASFVILAGIILFVTWLDR